MKRIALLAAAMFGGGCVVSESPGVGGVNVYWTFQRVDSSGTSHDLNCAEAGVDTVLLDFSDGTSNTVPCSQGGVDGVNVGNFVPGSYWVNVTGYRNGVSAALYTSGAVNFYVYAGSDAIANATVPGIPGDLAINAYFVNSNGTATIGTYCAAPGVAVDTITYDLVDSAGISVALGTMNCGSSSVLAGIDFFGSQGIDLDVYALRAQGRVGGATGTVIFDTATTQTLPTCTAQTLAHYGANTGSLAWNALLYDVSGNATLCP